MWRCLRAEVCVFLEGGKKTDEDAHLEIFLVLSFIKTLIFFLKAGIEVDFESFLELLFIQLFCSTLTGLFYRIIRTLLTMYAIAKSLLFVSIIMYKTQ